MNTAPQHLTRQAIPVLVDRPISPVERLINLLDAARDLGGCIKISVPADEIPQAEYVFKLWTSANDCVLNEIQVHSASGTVQRFKGIYTKRPAQHEIATLVWPPEPDPDLVRDVSHQVAQEREDMLEQDQARAEEADYYDEREDLKAELSDADYEAIYGAPRLR